MNIVAIFSPKPEHAVELSIQGSSKTDLDQPDAPACHIFALAERGTTSLIPGPGIQRGTFLLVIVIPMWILQPKLATTRRISFVASSENPTK